MKIVKGALLVFVGIFIFITLISLLIPGKIITARAVAVQADSNRLFKEISELKNWKHWHPVFIQDSASIKINREIGTNNEYAEWVTNGKKNTLFVTAKHYPSVAFLLKRDGENDSENTLSVNAVQEQGNMQVQWVSVIKLKWYPWEKFSGIFVEKMTGPGYEYALQSLKQFVESQ